MGEQHPAKDLLEPAALDDPDPTSRHFDVPGEHEIELSKAISLKRIADALSGDGAFNAGEQLGAGLEQIGFSIGQQIKRGMEAG